MEPWLDTLVHQAPIVALPVAFPFFLTVLGVSAAMVINWEQIVVLLVGIAIVLAGWHVAFQCLPPWFRRIATAAAQQLWKRVIRSSDSRRSW